MSPTNDEPRKAAWLGCLYAPPCCLALLAVTCTILRTQSLSSRPRSHCPPSLLVSPCPFEHTHSLTTAEGRDRSWKGDCLSIACTARAAGWIYIGHKKPTFLDSLIIVAAYELITR